MKKIIFIIILISISTPQILFAQEGVSCSVSPSSQVLQENESVMFTFSLVGSGDASRLSLGGLPGGVTGSFSDNKIILKALQGVQLGSFDISILYDVQENNILNQSYCSFNIIVSAAADRDTTQDYIPLPSHAEQTPAVIEDGVITSVPVSALTNTPADTANDDTFVSPLFVGINNDEVRKLQTLLKEKGYFPNWVTASGYYGEITEQAVAEFQADNNIDSVGFVGPLTRAALNNL